MDSSRIKDEVNDISSSNLEEIPGSEENLRAVMIRRILGEDKETIAGDLGLSKGSVSTYTSSLASAGYLENTGSTRKPDYRPGENLEYDEGFTIDDLDPSRPVESDYPFILQPMIVLDGLDYIGRSKGYMDDVPDDPEWFSKNGDIEAVEMSSKPESPEEVVEEIDGPEENGSEDGVEVLSINRDSIILEGGLAITGNGRLPDVEEGDLVEVEETGDTYMHGQFDKVEYLETLE